MDRRSVGKELCCQHFLSSYSGQGSAVTESAVDVHGPHVGKVLSVRARTNDSTGRSMPSPTPPSVQLGPAAARIRGRRCLLGVEARRQTSR